ncbi:MAG: S-layer homology domain-containing protein [Defluviitaleaceae bacterium]|nr:S-layer homology domain-containing protein [Defluviitaleaceae bacterium]
MNTIFHKIFFLVIIALVVFVLAPIGVTVNGNGVTPTPSPTQSPIPTPSPNFRAVSSINLSSNFGQTGNPFNLNSHATIWPNRTGEQYPTLSNIGWEVINISPNTFSASVSGAVLSTSGEGQGSVRVRATIPNGRANGEDFTQEFTLHFSNMAVIATLEGLHDLFANVPVDARVLFTLEGGGRFVDEIYPSDFWVTGLPSGLVAEEAERISNTMVSVKITGAPVFSTTSTQNLVNVPHTIAARNIRHNHANVLAHVVREWLSFDEITASATSWPASFTFDLNRYGSQHRNASVNLNPRGLEFRRIRFGAVELIEDEDYIRNVNHNFEIKSSFLERLPIGQWNLTFHMNRGANPTIIMNIIDSSQEVVTTPEIIPGPPPAPPATPLHPNENFMYLTGGTAVNISDLRWDLYRARVNPAIQNGAAEVTIRTHVLDHLSWNLPGQTFEIVTPMARLHVPVNILCLIYDGRFSIVSRELNYSDVDLRITLTDVSDNGHNNHLFDAFHPNGEKLTPLVDLRVDLINTITDEIILTAQEFTQPLDMTFVMMNNAAHLRPAGTLFKPSWLEFVPYRNFSPNEITTRSIFPGTQGIIHNRVHFEDVYNMHWGFAQSYTAAYSGLLFPVAELQPNAPITRGEFTQLLASALQLPRAGANDSGFVDVLPTSVFFDGVSRLFEAGLLGPRVHGAAFRPNQIITREEIAATVGMAIMLGNSLREPEFRPLSIAFTDFGLFTPHHITPVQETVNHGLMVGYPDSTFRPLEPASRIIALEAVVGLARLFGLLDEA